MDFQPLPEVVIRVRLIFEPRGDGAVQTVMIPAAEVVLPDQELPGLGTTPPAWREHFSVVRKDDLRLVLLGEGCMPSPMPPELADAYNRLMLALSR